jgi:uncharacterized protein
MESYSRRYVDNFLDRIFTELPAVLLDGPKGVGKTMTATQRASTILQLDEPGPRSIALSDPNLLLQGEKPILVDEWHKAEPIWSAVKRAVDADYSGGQFLLTGSLPLIGTHSGAARIASVRMRPMTLVERGATNPTVFLAQLLMGEQDISGFSTFSLNDYTREILSSGFPAINPLSAEARDVALSGYLDRVVDSDIFEAGLKVRRPEFVRNWLTAYAAAIGTNASWNTIRDAASRGDISPARSTVAPYIEALARIRILDEVEPWAAAGTQLQRLMVSPKHYLVDPALGGNLLGISEETALINPEMGRLFENLVAMSLRVFAEPQLAKLHHLRTQDGRREIDFILERKDGKVIAVEVKWGSVVSESDAVHLNWLQEQIGPRLIDKMIINTGEHAYRTQSGVAVIPLALLG